ncbi:MAG TPA: PD-(D/E)XK nuclease family protein [Solirubrobacteraceae bacterium]|nr:PD-(D/E)XK nuclease family protein [Solirubrobacteraceae bacterium]
MTDYRHFEPVAENVPAPSRISQTLARRMDVCPRSAYLYLRYKGGPSSAAMNRGTAFHIFAERMAVELIRRGERSLFAPAQIDPDDPQDHGEDLSQAARDVASLTQAMVEQVFEDFPDLTMPAAERDSTRAMAYHLAIGWDVDPQAIVGVERMFSLELECGWTIVGKVDLATLPSATVGEVADYKTTLAVPSQEEHAQSFQAKLYALLLMYGRPVDGEPFGSHLTHVTGRMIYPRAKPRETGKGLRLVQREATWSRGQLDEFRMDVEALGRRVSDALESGDWAAQAGPHCSECPAPRECPIPRELRNYAGTILEPEQASEAWEWAMRAKAAVAAVEKEVKAFAKAHGGVVVGDQVFEWRVSESRRLRSVGGRSDWDGLAQAVLDAATYGTPFELEEFVKWVPKNEFKSRPVVAEEMSDDGGAEAGPDERSPDERWGDVPF